MPSICEFLHPRQKVTIETRGELLLTELQEMILNDFKYIAEILYTKFIKSRIIKNIMHIPDASSYSGYMSLDADSNSSIALKLLSIFDYITYEIVGGEEPEIFIRLNDPNKIRNIVLGNTFYINDYVVKAKRKHDRDVAILMKFFNDLQTDEERWNYLKSISLVMMFFAVLKQSLSNLLR